MPHFHYCQTYAQAKSKLTRVHQYFLQLHLLPCKAQPQCPTHTYTCSGCFHALLSFPTTPKCCSQGRTTQAGYPLSVPPPFPAGPQIAALNTPRQDASIITPPTLHRSSLLCLSHLNNLLKAAGKRSPFHDCNITVNTLQEWDVKCILPSGLWAQKH